jgi:hypothetical protein
MEICPKAEAAGEIGKPVAGQIINGLAGIWGKNFCPLRGLKYTKDKSMT